MNQNNCYTLIDNMKYLLVFSLGLFFSCQSQDLSNSKTINGICLVSEKTVMQKADLEPILAVNVEWCAVIPFSFMQNLSDPGLKFNAEWQWKGERLDGCQENIQLMHSQGLHVMLKPQIWIGHGEFTGKIQMKSEEDWILFEENYSKYILAFAQMAEENDVELFCIGTEMKRVVMERASYWRTLINKIRKIYSGKLTYAENWDCYADVPFWEELDFIGIDAYFPLVPAKTPSISSLNNAWEKHLKRMKLLSEDLHKKVLFTEFGYRSVDYCAKSPWDYGKKGEVNELAQFNALSSIFETFWEKDFFAGGFLWKWHPNHHQSGGVENKMFTIQRKKSEQLVKKIYRESKEK